MKRVALEEKSAANLPLCILCRAFYQTVKIDPYLLIQTKYKQLKS
jgi:hypothetical protein